MARQIQYSGAVIQVPDDATDDEVAEVLAAHDATKAQRAVASVDARNAEAKVKPFEPGPLESAGRYMADWGQGMRDAASNVASAVPSSPLKGAKEALLSLGSGYIAPVIGAAQKGFAAQTGRGIDYRDARDNATYKPQGRSGQALVGAIGAVAKPVGDAISYGSEKLTDAGVNPEAAAFVGDAVGMAADVAPLVAGKAIASSRLGGAGDAAKFVDPTQPFGPKVAQARKLDYRVLPSQVNAKAQVDVPPGKINASPTGTWRQTFAGPTIKDRFTIDNQKRTNSYAAKDLGISEITEQSLELAKYPHNAVYNEVARAVPYIRRDAGLEEAINQLGGPRRDNPLLRQTREVEMIRERILSADTMTTQQVLDAIREYRKDASTAFQKVGDVEAEQAAYAYRGAADALEEALERQAGAVDPSLIPRLKDARTGLAKIHNYQAAFDGTNIDPQALVKLGKKYPLSGYAKEIADTATNFPHTMKLATGLEIDEPSNQSLLMSLNLAARRAGGREQVPTIMSDKFQNRYGAADPTFDPRPAPRQPDRPAFSEYQPPGPDALPPAGGTMPPAPGGGPGLTAVNLADDFDTLPPADAFPGDLTAETPPMGGSLPAGLADDLIDAPDFGLEAPAPRGADTLDFANDPDLAALLAGDDPLGQRVPQAPGGDALDLGTDLMPPMSDLELLDLILQTAAPPGTLGPVRPRPLPLDPWE